MDPQLWSAIKNLIRYIYYRYGIYNFFRKKKKKRKKDEFRKS